MAARKTKTRNATLLRRIRELEDIGGEVGNMLAEPASDELHNRAHKAPKRLRAYLVRYQRACSLAGVMLSDFSVGFGARTKSGTLPRQAEDPLHVEYSLNDGHEAMQLAVRWGATYLTAELEHFIRGTGRLQLSGDQLNRIRLSSRRPQHLAPLDRKAREQLILTVLPTHGSSTKWGRNLSLVFGRRFPGPVLQSLQSMVQWRHEASHRNNPPMRADWSGENDGAEAIIAWVLAGFALSNAVVCAVLDGQS